MKFSKIFWKVLNFIIIFHIISGALFACFVHGSPYINLYERTGFITHELFLTGVVCAFFSFLVCVPFVKVSNFFGKLNFAKTVGIIIFVLVSVEGVRTLFEISVAKLRLSLSIHLSALFGGLFGIILCSVLSKKLFFKQRRFL